MNEAMDYRRMRATVSPTFQISLPPEIARAAEMAAQNAGMTAEALIVDILRDVFEPVFDGRGKRAVEATDFKQQPLELGSPVVNQPSNAEEVVP